MVLFEQEGLWGYKNDKGEVVIEPLFVIARDFKNGFAVVAIDYVTKYNYCKQSSKMPKLFYIDETGHDVFYQTFEEASDFSENGYAWARKNSWMKGSIVLLPSLANICHGEDLKYFKLLNNGWGYVHSNFGVSAKRIGGKTSLYDRNGKILVSKECYGVFKTDPEEPGPSFVVSDFSDGLLKISFDSEIVFVDENFNTILTIPIEKYKSIGDYNRGKAKVEIHDEKFVFFDIDKLSTKEVIGKPSNSQYADYYLIDGEYYDKRGNNIAEEALKEREKNYSFIGDRAIVYSSYKDVFSDRWLYVNIINRQKQIIAPNLECYYFSQDLSRWAPLSIYEWHSNEWDKNTLLIHPNDFISEIKYVLGRFKDSTLFIYNKNGQVIFSELTARPIGYYSSGFLLIEKSIYGYNCVNHKEFFFIDTKGKKHFVQDENLVYTPFVNGFAKIKKPIHPNDGFSQLPSLPDYLVGYINTKFEITIPIQYKESRNYRDSFICGDFSCNIVRIIYCENFDNRKYFFINTKGDKVLDLSEYDNCGTFYNNVTYVSKDGYSKIIDIAGNIIVDLIAGEIIKSDESSIVFNNSLCGFIDKAGDLIVKPDFENVEEFEDTGKCRVIKNGIKGYINDDGQFLQIN